MIKKIIATALLAAGMCATAFGQTGVAPKIIFLETDQTLPAGLWRIQVDGNTLTIDRNTSGSNNFSSAITALTLSSSGNITISGDGPHAIGNGALGNIRLLLGGAFTSSGVGSDAKLLLVQGRLTGAAGDIDFLTGAEFDGRITTQTATESIDNLSQAQFNEPQITNNLTGAITDAQTVLITGAPTEGVSNFAFRVVSGTSQFGGTVQGAIGSSYAILNEAASATNPTLIPNRLNLVTGIGGVDNEEEDNLHLIVESTNVVDITTSQAIFNLTDKVRVNGRIEVLGNTNQTQLFVRGFSTQTGTIVQIENFAQNSILEINDLGTTTLGREVATSIDALVLGHPSNPGPAGTLVDSHAIVWTGTSFDGGAHDIDWKAFVDVTANDGTGSIWTLQTRIDGASFTDQLTVEAGSSVLGLPQDTASIQFGAALDAQIHRGNSADIIEQRRGSNDQRWHIYDNFTSFADYDRLAVYIGGGPPDINAFIRPESTDATQAINLTISSLPNGGTGTGNLILQAGSSGARLTLSGPISANNMTFAGGGTFTLNGDLLVDDLIATVGAQETTPGVGILFDLGGQGSGNFADSHSINMIGRGELGNLAEWRLFVDVTDTSANSIFTIQNDQNEGGFTDQLILDPGSATLGLPQDAASIQFGAALDVQLHRDFADVLALRRGTNDQFFYVYGTFTNPTNYERLSVYAGSSVNHFLESQTAGTGADDINLNIKSAGAGNLLFVTGATTTTVGGSGDGAWSISPTNTANFGDPNNNWKNFFAGTSFVAGISLTSPGESFVLNSPALIASGQRDSNALLWTGKGHSVGVPRDVDWKAFVDVTADDGTGSIWTLQTRINAAGYADKFTISDSSIVTFPQTTGSFLFRGAGPHSFGGPISDFTQFRFTGGLTSGGNSSEANKMSLESTVTGFAGDTLQIAGLNINVQLRTQTATENIANIATVILQEPQITDNLTGGGLIIQASTLFVSSAPSEGSDINSAILIGAANNQVGTYDAITIDQRDRTSSGQDDSGKIVLTGVSHDGSPHDADWRQFVDVTSNAGASTWTLQNRIDAASFGEVLTITSLGRFDFLSPGTSNDVVIDTSNQAGLGSAGLWMGIGPVLSISNYTLAGNGTASTILNVQTGGTIRFRFSNTDQMTLTESSLTLNTAASLNWSTDLKLFRDNPQQLALRDGLNDNFFYIYGTFTDSSNYERLAVYAGAAATHFLEPQSAGTGASSINMAVRPGGVGDLILGRAGNLGAPNTGTAFFNIKGRIVEIDHNSNSSTTTIRINQALLALPSGSSVTQANIVPAGALIVAINTRVITTITGPATYSIGDGVDPDRYGTGIPGDGSAISGVGDYTSDIVSYAITNGDVVITSDGVDFTGGTVRISVHYIRADGPLT